MGISEVLFKVKVFTVLVISDINTCLMKSADTPPEFLAVYLCLPRKE